MAATLRVIEPELPQTRRALAEVLERRKALNDRVTALNGPVERLQRLIDAETTARARVEELDKAATAEAERWARAPGSELAMPSHEEHDQASRELAHASRLATAARSALADIERDRAPLMAEIAPLADLATEATRQVFYDEIIPAITIEREQHLQRARAAESRLLSIGEFFRQSRRSDEAPGHAFARFSQVVRGILFPGRKPEEASASLELKQQYLHFAARISKDPSAQL